MEFTDAEIMVLIGLLNGLNDAMHDETGHTILEHTSRTPGNPVRTFKTDGREIVRKLLNEAMKRGVLKPPTCWNPPS